MAHVRDAISGRPIVPDDCRVDPDLNIPRGEGIRRDGHAPDVAADTDRVPGVLAVFHSPLDHGRGLHDRHDADSITKRKIRY